MSTHVKHHQTTWLFLFSGHGIDRPARAEPRFPAECEAIAAARIGEALDSLHAQPADIALAQAAAGGDILFGEACLARGLDLRILLPLPEAEFIATSIISSWNGDAWLHRYSRLHAQLQYPVRVLADDAHNQGSDPFSRCNQWLLDSALALTGNSLQFICLWDGAEGDGSGSTAHMVEQVRQQGGRVTWLDTRQLWPSVQRITKVHPQQP